MYNNELGRNLSKQINEMNRKAVRHSNLELEGEGMTGGFLGTLAKALMPTVISGIGNLLGLGMSGGAYMDDSMEGGAILNKLREKMMMEGYGKASAEYKKMDESKYGCGDCKGCEGCKGAGFISDLGIPVVSGLAGMFGLGATGGASGTVEGTFRDTGFEKTEGAKGVEGAGFISDLGIPVVSGLAGLFGLGQSGGKKRGRKSKMGKGLTGGMIMRQPIKVPDFELNNAIVQRAQNIPKGEPEQKVVLKSQMKGSDLSGFGKRDNTFLMKLKQKKMNGKKFTKAEMARLEKMKPRLEGMGFWSDFADGFMSVVKPVASVVKNVTGLIPHPYAQTASGILSALGAGKSGGKRGRPKKMSGGVGQPHPAVAQIKRNKQNADKVLNGGAKKMTPYMELVMKIKKETGKSLKDTMKHVKENGLYKK